MESYSPKIRRIDKKNSLIDINSTIYGQDCENYRYQDGLKWSRFQTASTIEGAILFALYQSGFTRSETVIIMIFGFLLVMAICFLSLKDEVSADKYFDRMEKFEKSGEKLVQRKWNKFLSGRILLRFCIVLLNVFNIIVLIYKGIF